jgi:methionyl aminopeptidase
MARTYKKIILKTPEEIAIIRENGRIIAQIFDLFRKEIKPGLSTLDLDKIAEQIIHSHEATPSFKGYDGFPASICSSLNDMVIHGIPSSKDILKEGDILGVDVGVFKNGFHADSAFTFQIGKVSPDVERLCKVNKEALARGIAQARIGRTIFDIANAIESYVTLEKMGNVKDFVGHGVGRELHEAPQIPNYRQPGLSHIKLKEGMVLAIEPMLALGSGEVFIKSDGWGVLTKDHTPAAHFEHTIAITLTGPRILTDL